MTLAPKELPPLQHGSCVDDTKGFTDCAEIWCVFGDPLVWRSTKVNGAIHVHVGHVRTLPYLGNSWTDCAETWCVVRGPLAMRLTQHGGCPHERTCNCTYIHLSKSVHSRSFIAQKAQKSIPPADKLYLLFCGSVHVNIQKKILFRENFMFNIL